MVINKKEKQKADLEAYEHHGKERLNNPPVGLVTPDTDKDAGKKTYAYDPHLDPQLVWAGKAEHTSFEVPTVSLHVHERIDPRTIIEAARKRQEQSGLSQLSLFSAPEENPPIRQAIEFYKHKHNWTNRLIAGDSLLVMNSLLEKEGMAGKVQMIYIDPPYGIKYGSNFQPFINKRDVKDGKDEDLTQEPEMIRAFRDTWELGIHSYLTYLRDRLLLARELLTESGSIFVQIGDENLHLVRILMDEVFGAKNLCALITFSKTSPLGTDMLPQTCDYLAWYARDRTKLKYRQLYKEKTPGELGATRYTGMELQDGTRVTASDYDGNLSDVHLFSDSDMSAMYTTPHLALPFEFEGREFKPSPGRQWQTTQDGLKRLAVAKRLMIQGHRLRYIRYLDDFPVNPIQNLWPDIGGIQSRSDPKVYAVQTSTTAIRRCILMTTDPGDLVLDPTCGSGTTAYVAEHWGRRWITCDTSRVSIALAKQRLMTAIYDYYDLAHPREGVGSGFKYRTVPHITLKSIANNPEIDGIHARWQKKLEPLRTELNRLLDQDWQEWEIPREPDEGWSAKAKEILQQWWELRRKRQEEIDASIAKYAEQETLYDQPFVDRKITRVTGPFTVEAVPAPAVRALSEVQEEGDQEANESMGRYGETLRQDEWRGELLKAGIRGKSGQKILFSRVEPLAGTRWLHADAETKEDTPQRVVISFGPEHAPLEQRQVALAIEEAQSLVPKPKIIVFAAFQFNPEASKDIDETHWPGVMLLKAQMNADLLTEDLKKKRASNESFWLIGQPDVELEKIAKGDDTGKYRVSVHGFDYYNTKTGGIESGGFDKIAMWMLDPDYDGRSLLPRQVFFPMAGPNDGWAKLAKSLKAEIDEALIEAYRGTTSLPFEPGKHRRVAVKIIDDRGIESLKVVEVSP